MIDSVIQNQLCNRASLSGKYQQHLGYCNSLANHHSSPATELTALLQLWPQDS